MAQVPVSQGNRVALQPLPAANFRPVDFGSVGQAIGQGAEGLGRQLGVTAETQQRLAEIRAEEEARRLDTEHMEAIRPFRERVRQARGINARTVATEAEQEMRKFNSEFIGRASTPLARNLLQQSIRKRTVQEVDTWSTHAIAQEGEAIDTGFADRAEGFAETALDHAGDDDVREQNIAAGVNEIRARAKWRGWDDATTALEVSKFTSRVRVGQARQKFEAEDPEGALAILDAYPDEIRDGDEAALRRMIKGEIDLNLSESDAAAAIGQAPAPEGVPDGEQVWQPPVRAHTVTVKGGEYGATRGYGSHQAHDYAGVKQGTPVYPMAEGVVRKVYNTPGGGNTVEIEYAGGYKSKYLHLADGSTAGLQEGQRVTPTTQVGGVGNTGTASHGVHLHAELIGPNGRKVDPDRMIGAKASGARLPAPDGSRVDLSTAYAYIDRQPWSESRKRRARESVQRFAGDNDVVKARSEQDADRQITERLVDLNRRGTKLTSMTQLPADALGRASPNTVLRLQEQIDANNKKSEAQPNSPLMAQLTLMAANDPNSFLAQVNPELYRGVLPDSEVMELHKMRTTIDKRSGPQPSQIISVINNILPTTGIVTAKKGSKKEEQEAQARARILRGVQERLSGLGKAEITEQDIWRAVRAEVTLVTPTGKDDPVPLFQVRESHESFKSNIPVAAIPTIDRNLRALGIPINNQNRFNLYIENKEELDRLAR